MAVNFFGVIIRLPVGRPAHGGPRRWIDHQHHVDGGPDRRRPPSLPHVEGGGHPVQPVAACDLAEYGIRVNCVAPGHIHRDHQLRPRAGHRADQPLQRQGTGPTSPRPCSSWPGTAPPRSRASPCRWMAAPLRVAPSAGRPPRGRATRAPAPPDSAFGEVVTASILWGQPRRPTSVDGGDLRVEHAPPAGGRGRSDRAVASTSFMRWAPAVIAGLEHVSGDPQRHHTPAPSIFVSYCDTKLWGGQSGPSSGTRASRRRAIEETLGTLPAADRRRITALNCATLYGFEYVP